MATNLEFRDFDNALLIRAKRTPSLTEGVVSAAAAGGCVAIVFFRIATMRVAITMSLLAAFMGFLYAMRKRDAELRVTNVEFESRGLVGDNLGSTRRVCPTDIRWLEYQEDTSGAETSPHPGGLYAVLKSRSMCILPDIDERQTALVIDRILAKFPEFQEQWRRNSSFGKHFISLGLNNANS